MKQKRVALIALIFAALAVIWVFVLQQFLKIDQTREQNAYVESADAFAEKELYVRAIDAYNQALAINTTEKKKNKIEAKLLKAYKAYGDMTGYENLAESRISRGVASENEIVSVSKMYSDSNLFKEALKATEAGLELHPDSEKIAEEHSRLKYMYNLNYVTATELKMDDSTGRIVAFDGEKWSYITKTGSLVFKISFDEATPFYKDDEGNQFAVVRNGKTYYVVNKDCALYGRDDTGVEEVLGIASNHVIAKKNGKYGFYDYDFVSSSEKHQYDLITMNSNGVVAIQDGGKWGVITDGGQTVIPLELDEVAVNSLGQAYRGGNAMVKRGKSWEMVDLQGKKVGDGTYANAKAPESTEYIAVANEQNQWGFIDREGKLVIDYQYKDAYSFSDGVAAVKTATGWQYIDENNKVIIDEELSEALPFHSGLAIAKDGDANMIISFENYK